MPLCVDVMTGETVLREVDLRLPGYLPLTLARTYRSGREDKGALGKGWRMSLKHTLTLNDDAWIYESATRTVHFDPIEEGVRATHATGLVLEHHSDAYLVYASPRFKRIFPKENERRGAVAVEQIADQSSNAVKFFYEGDRLAGVVDTLGRSVRFDYRGPAVSAVRLGGPGGSGSPAVRREFSYDARGRLTRATDAAGRSTQYEYSGRFLVRRAGPGGGACLAQYDADGRCHTRWREDGAGAHRFFYDDLRQTTRVVSRDGAQTLYRCVVGSGVLEQVGPEGDSQNYYYDEQQRLIGFSDEHENVLTFQRLDPDEQTLTLIHGEERVAFMEVNEDQLAEAVSNPFDHEWTLEYDAHHHPVRLTTPAEETWTVERNRRGGVTAVASPEGRRVQLQRGENGRERTVRDERGVIRTERYDEDGRLTEREDAAGRTQRRSYDDEGRLTGVEAGSGSEGRFSVQFRYDAAGRLTRATDAERGRFTLERDAAGRLRTHTGADRSKFQFQYDDDGRLASASDGERGTAQFEYEAYGRLAEAAWPGGRTTQYRYDEDGLEARTQTPEGETVRRYDLLRNLTREEVRPDGTAHTFDYGPSGELRSVETDEEDDAPLYFDYHPDGQVAEVMSDDATLSFSYDRDGHLTRVEDEEERTLILDRDGRGRVEAVRAEFTAEKARAAAYRLAYDDGGRIETLRAPSGAEHRFQFDAVGRLRERTTIGRDGERDTHAFSLDGRAEPQIEPCPWPRASTATPPTDGAADTNGAARARTEALDAAAENGTPEDGIPEDGAPEDGAPEDGAPEDGALGEAEEVPGMEDAEPEDGEKIPPVELELLQSRSVVALLASWGALRVPVWIQHARPHRHDLTPQLAAALVRGPGAALSTRRTPTGPALLRRWTEDAATGRLRDDYTALPLPHELGRGRRALRHFFLSPAVYDYHYQQSRPGVVPPRRAQPARTPHAALVGSHTDQRLKPSAWEACAVAPYLNRGRFVPPPGGLRPEDVMQAWNAQTRPAEASRHQLA